MTCDPRRVVRLKVSRAGTAAFGTGYLVSPTAILTARHVLTGESYRPEMTVLPSGFALSDDTRIKASLCDVRVEDTKLRVQSYWLAAKRDLAIVRCESVPSFDKEIVPVLDRTLREHEQWSGRGIPVFSMVNRQSEVHALAGAVLGSSDGLDKLDLSVEVDCRAWSGVSGAPVLVNGAVAGVVGQACEVNWLMATVLRGVLDEPGFREAYGLSAHEAELEAAARQRVQKLLGAALVRQVLAEQLDLGANDAAENMTGDIAVEKVAAELCERVRRDPTKLARALYWSADRIQGLGTADAFQVLKGRPFSQLLQVLLPLYLGRRRVQPCPEGTEALVAEVKTKAVAEAAVAGGTGRSAYWNEDGGVVFGDHCVVPGAGEAGWSGKLPVVDVGQQLALRRGMAFPEDSSKQEEALKDLNCHLEDDAECLDEARGPEQRAKAERLYHPYYVLLAQEDSKDFGVKLGKALPAMQRVLEQPSPADAIRKTDLSLEQSLLKILRIEAQPEVKEGK